jgi:hypothetical protein
MIALLNSVATNSDDFIAMPCMVLVAAARLITIRPSAAIIHQLKVAIHHKWPG